MKKNTINMVNRSIASVLLISQILTSCGGGEIILPSTPSPTHQNMGVSDDKSPSSLPINTPIPLAVPDSKGYDSDYSSQSFTPSTYTNRRGDRITLIPKGDKYVARVQEQLPPGFSRSPRMLPVRFQQGLFPEDLTASSYVDVVFPAKGKQYVFCAEHEGLLGGVFDCLDKNRFWIPNIRISFTTGDYGEREREDRKRRNRENRERQERGDRDRREREDRERRAREERPRQEWGNLINEISSNFKDKKINNLTEAHETLTQLKSYKERVVSYGQYDFLREVTRTALAQIEEGMSRTIKIINNMEVG